MERSPGGARLVRSALELLAEQRSPQTGQTAPLSSSALTTRGGGGLTTTTTTTTSVSTANHPPASSILHPPAAAAASSSKRSRSNVLTVTDTMKNVNHEVPFGPPPHHFVEERTPPAQTRTRQSASPRRAVDPQQQQVQVSSTTEAPPSNVVPVSQTDGLSALAFISPSAFRTREQQQQQQHEPQRKKSAARRAHSASGRSLDSADVSSRRAATATDVSVDVDRLIDAAVLRYKQQRDAEDQIIVQQVQEEMARLESEIDRLRSERNQALDEQEPLRDLVEKLESQCRVLNATTTSIHEELQAAKQDARKWEETARRSDDARREYVTDSVRDAEFLRAQLLTEKDEVLRRERESHQTERDRMIFELHEATTQLTESRGQVETLLKQLNSAKQAVDEKSADLVASERRNQELREELTKVTRVTVHRASSEVQKQAAEHTALQERIKSLEDALKTQTDDIRKKMYRLQQLETDNKQLSSAKEHFEDRLVQMEERWSRVHDAVLSLVRSIPQGNSKHKKDPSLLDEEVSLEPSLDEEEEEEDARRLNKRKSLHQNPSHFPSARSRSGTIGAVRSASAGAALSRAPAGRSGGKGTGSNTLSLIVTCHDRIKSFVKALKHRLKVAQSEGTEQTARATSLEREHLLLSTRITEVETDLEVQVDRNSRLTSRVAELEMEVVSKSEELRLSKQDARELDRRVHLTQETVHRLQFEVDELRAERDGRVAHVAKLEAQRDAAASELTKLQTKVEESQTHIKRLEQEKENAVKQWNEVNVQLAQQARDASEAATVKERTQRQLQRLHVELSQSRGEVSRIRGELQAVTLRAEKAETATATLRKTQTARSQQHLESLEQKASARIAALEKQLEQHDAEQSQTIRECQKDLEATSSQLLKYKNRMRGLLEQHTQEKERLATRIGGLLVRTEQWVRSHCHSTALGSLSAPSPSRTAPFSPEPAVPTTMAAHEAYTDRLLQQSLQSLTPSSSNRSSAPVATRLADRLAEAATEDQAQLSDARPMGAASSVEEGWKKFESLIPQTLQLVEAIFQKQSNEIQNARQTIDFLETELQCASVKKAVRGSGSPSQKWAAPFPAASSTVPQQQQAHSSLSPVRIPSPHSSSSLLQQTKKWEEPAEGGQVEEAAGSIAFHYSAPSMKKTQQQLENNQRMGTMGSNNYNSSSSSMPRPASPLPRVPVLEPHQHHHHHQPHELPPSLYAMPSSSTSVEPILHSNNFTTATSTTSTNATAAPWKSSLLLPSSLSSAASSLSSAAVSSSRAMTDRAVSQEGAPSHPRDAIMFHSASPPSISYPQLYSSSVLAADRGEVHRPSSSSSSSATVVVDGGRPSGLNVSAPTVTSFAHPYQNSTAVPQQQQPRPVMMTSSLLVGGPSGRR